MVQTLVSKAQAASLRRVWNYALAQSQNINAAAKVDAAQLNEAQKTLRRAIHRTLQQADNDLRRIQYNTVVSACMILLNTLEGAKLDDSAASKAVISEGFSIFLRVLNPIAPHITHTLWQDLGYAQIFGDILNALAKADQPCWSWRRLRAMIQINGKLCGSIKVAKEADKATIEAAALANDRAKIHRRNAETHHRRTRQAGYHSR